jgi:hypothetical protein
MEIRKAEWRARGELAFPGSVLGGLLFLLALQAKMAHVFGRACSGRPVATTIGSEVIRSSPTGQTLAQPAEAPGSHIILLLRSAVLGNNSLAITFLDMSIFPD